MALNLPAAFVPVAHHHGIPATEQGIISADQGIPAQQQGILPAKSEIIIG